MSRSHDTGISQRQKKKANSQQFRTGANVYIGVASQIPNKLFYNSSGIEMCSELTYQIRKMLEKAELMLLIADMDLAGEY